MNKSLERKQDGLICMPGETLLPIIRETLSCGGKFVLTVTGSSMAPTLHHKKDRVELVSPEVRRPKKGEIVLFQRLTGECVLHRVLEEKDGLLHINGDAQRWTEWIHHQQIVGVVSRICRNGCWRSCDERSYRGYVALWRMTKPLRPTLIRLRNLLRKEDSRELGEQDHTEN